MKNLLLIDAHALIHRAFHALPSFVSRDGKPTGALYGLSSILLKILKDTPPDYVVAFFDRPEPTFRVGLSKEYKAHREEKAQELVSQLVEAHNLFKTFGVKTFEAVGFEGDDLIGTAAERFKKEKDLKITILTGDLDALQLVDGNKVVVETLKKGVSETIIYGETEVYERYGIKPAQLKDYKGLVGDTSDNITGVKGVGPKTAQALITDFGSLENFFTEFAVRRERGDLDKPFDKTQGKKDLALEKIFLQKEDAMLSKQLATIRLDAPLEIKDLEELKFEYFPTEQVAEYFKNLGFKSLLQRLNPHEHEASDQQLHPIKSGKAGAKQFDGASNQGMLDFNHQPTLSHKLIEEFEKPLEPILKEMEAWGIKADCDKLKEKLKELEEKTAELSQQIYREAGQVFNINSPKQLLEILKTKFKLKLKSTAEDKIEIFKEVPIIELILKYREHFKLKSTYIEPLLVTASREKNCRIHPTFVQLKAATGRITCENPNLQNIPEWVRDVFVADYGFKLVSLDYSQIELRVLAHVSKDKKIIEAFKNDTDIHALTASHIFNVEQKDVTSDMRRMAKTLNFGIIYGMGSRALAQQSGLSQKEARKFIDEYFNDFPTIKQWKERVLMEAREKGFVENMNGRIRVLPEIISFNQRLQSEAERMATNFPIQSVGADILKLAMVKVKEYLSEEGLWDKEVRMLLTIHDELVLEVKNTPKLKSIVEKIKEIMENVFALDVPLKVNVAIGDNWGEL